MVVLSPLLAQQHIPLSKESSFGGPLGVGMLEKGDVVEASGLAASQVNKGLLWTHDDSGNEPYVYGLDNKGAIVCTLKVSSANNIDWEDIAVGKGPQAHPSYVYVGDIGDNDARRSKITVYRFPEPQIGTKDRFQEVRADALTFTYPDGARDAETLFVDPLTEDLYIVSKRERKNRVYRAKAPHVAGLERVLEFVTELPVSVITAGDISPSGSEVILKNYVYAYYWKRNNGEPLESTFSRAPSTIPYMPEPQGEAICFSADAKGYYTISERADTSRNVELLYYGRTMGGEDAMAIRDVTRPSMSIAPSKDTEGIYDLRYNVPKYGPVKISVFNYIMMNIEDVETGTSESGVQEREIDMIDKPDGTYVVILHASGSYNAIPLVVSRP